MADILIPNMELPTSSVILMIDEKGEVWKLHNASEIINRTKWEVLENKAIELPPHGRLGDLDIMKEAFEATALTEASRDKGNEQVYFDRIKLVTGIIDRTPTIVEASENYYRLKALALAVKKSNEIGMDEMCRFAISEFERKKKHGSDN